MSTQNHSANIRNLEMLIQEISSLRKSAFQPAPPPPGAMPPGMAPGMPVDPNTGMPIDPNTGMPMDPAMMGGMPPGPPPGMPPGPPPGMPMDPAMMGGMPPGPPPGPPPSGGLSPEMEQIVSQLMTGVDELAGMVEQQAQQIKTLTAQLSETRNVTTRMEAQFHALEKMLDKPAPFSGGAGLEGADGGPAWG